jgi:hypothetical protein
MGALHPSAYTKLPLTYRRILVFQVPLAKRRDTRPLGKARVKRASSSVSSQERAAKTGQRVASASTRSDLNIPSIGPWNA